MFFYLFAFEGNLQPFYLANSQITLNNYYINGIQRNRQ